MVCLLGLPWSKTPCPRNLLTGSLTPGVDFGKGCCWVHFSM